MSSKSHLLLSTRKGLIVYQKKSDDWIKTDSHFTAIPVTISFEDSRNGTWWACLDHGHWGVKLNRSTDKGKTWEEVNAPQYPEGYMVKDDIPAKTEYIWAMAGGGEDHPERLWMGTIPGGLFKSEDNGDSWTLNESLWNHPSRADHWFGAGFDHPGVHSIIVDPRNSDRIVVGVSVAGVFETTDGGETWQVRNKGLRADFLPDPDTDVGHDPHIIASNAKHPDILWQQNHCGIYRSTDGAKTWTEIGKKGSAAHFGFVITPDEVHPDTAWVAPAVADEYRVAPNEALCICRTEDGGQSWKELRNGLPQENCYDIVYRHAMAVTGDDIVFGTTTGNVFYSNDRGNHWKTLSNYLPMVHAVSFAE